MLDNNVVEELQQAWKDKSLVNISGVNSYGEPFSSQGKLISMYGAEMGIFQDSGTILIEFEPMKISENKIIKLAIPFETEFNDNNNLIALKIDVLSKTVFDNPNKTEILEKAREHKLRTEENLKSEGRDLVVDCPVVRGLRSLIGKPVVLDNDYGVVISVKGSDLYNNPIAYLRNDLRVDKCLVVGESCLYTNNLAKELILAVQNDPYQFWCDTKFDNDNKLNGV